MICNNGSFKTSNKKFTYYCFEIGVNTGISFAYSSINCLLRPLTSIDFERDFKSEAKHKKLKSRVHLGEFLKINWSFSRNKIIFTKV